MAAALPRVFGRCSSVSSRCSSLSSLVGKTRGMKIASAKPANDGKQVDVEFADKTSYRFHTAWIKDSSPSNAGNDFYRTSARGVFDHGNYIASEVTPSACGTKLEVTFKNGSEDSKVNHEYVAKWLHAFAPHVGRPLHESSTSSSSSTGLQGTGSMLDELYGRRKGWDADLKMPTYTYEELLSSEAKQLELLEHMSDPGVARILGMPAPDSLEISKVGLPMEQFLHRTIGRLNMHPVRATRYGVIQTSAEGAELIADYDHAKPLSMHTEHSAYIGSASYLQFMTQVQGSATYRVCDGIALAEHLRDNHPEEYKLLTEVQITHSGRNQLYTVDGSFRAGAEGAEDFDVELVHTHPIIKLDEKGHFEQVVQSEAKRGVCALPFDTYSKFMDAYRLLTRLAEDPRFVHAFDWPEHSMIATNNWRVLHGRADVAPGTVRTVCLGEIQKNLFENRYRLLKQRETTERNPQLNQRWLTRMPNQVLLSLVKE